MRISLLAGVIAAVLLSAPLPAHALVSPQPGDTCTGGQTGYFVTNSGSLQHPGYFLVCDGSHWNLFLSFATSGYVGIGTTGPNTLLHVNGAETLGLNGTTTGTLLLANGGASGASVTLQNKGATAAYNFNLPTTPGPQGALLASGGGAATAMTWVADVAAGQLLTSQGATANPAYSSTPTLGIPATTTGTLTLANGAATGTTVTLQPNASMTAANWTMTLPTTAGTNTYVLQTDGSGVTSWVAPGSGATITLGTSASATNPQRSGDATTGLFSATVGTVSVAAAGTDEADFAAGGLNLPVATESYKINGVNALWQDNTNANIAVGDTAFPTTVSQTGGVPNGHYNTSVGYLALDSNTTGNRNTAIGYGALALTTTGTGNVAIGAQTLVFNTTGSSNVALGSLTLYSNTANYNMAIGASALTNNTAGTANVAIGFDTLTTNTTGNYNIGIGYAALAQNVTGSGNVALGYLGLGAATGNGNVSFGYDAGYDVTSGGENIIIGYYPTTGVGITTGSNNILIGFNLAELSQTGSNQLDIGNLIFATGLGSGTTMSTGNVGIGTTSPAAKLDVNGNSIIIETANTPADNATCTAGTIWWDTGFIYVCTASGTVKRAALSTF